MRSEEMSQFRNGMSDVFLPPPSHSGLTSVAVFVHGLFGHPWRTWADTNPKTAKSDQNIFWPRDLLPAALGEKTHIVTFGYDADVNRFMAAAGRNTVHEHGKNLLNDLLDLLERLSTGSLESSPSLILVAHSLGGLVVKEALNQSCAATDERQRRVVESTLGVVFLGTPHRGSSAASYGKIAFTIPKIFAAQSPNIKLLRALEKNSETLDRITTAFYATTTQHPRMSLFSFCEEKDTRKSGISTRIVPPDSAKIGHPREDFGSIPADHRGMAKFTTALDIGFMRVSNLLKRWIKEYEERIASFRNSTYKDCMKSLDNPEARARIAQVSERHRESFGWLFGGKVAFVRWLADTNDEFSPIFWISGRPGSGKSTLMRFAMHDPRLMEALPPGRGTPAAYFFHLRGKNIIQKSLRGMLLELLYQLLGQFPDHFESIRGTYTEVRGGSAQHEQKKWTKSLLKAALKALVRSLLRHGAEGAQTSPSPRCVLFVDALDENENMSHSDNRELLQFMQDLAGLKRGKLAPRPILKICLASRPWPIFQKYLGDDPKICNFAMQDFTASDITSYAMAMLEDASMNQQVSEKTSEQVKTLASMICDKAKGVFIWVRIVLQEICQNIIDGSPLSEIGRHLSTLPEELHVFYEYMMKRIDPKYALEALVVCKMVLCCRRQLTLGELFAATMMFTTGRVEEMHSDSKHQVAWLRSRTGGLVEIETSEDREPRLPDSGGERSGGAKKNVVQFVHQTAQEFVRGGACGLRLNSDPSRASLHKRSGHYFIYQAVTTIYPPPPALRALSLDVVYHLKRINDDQDPGQREEPLNKPDVWLKEIDPAYRFDDKFSYFLAEEYPYGSFDHGHYSSMIQRFTILTQPTDDGPSIIPSIMPEIGVILHGLDMIPLRGSLSPEQCDVLLLIAITNGCPKPTRLPSGQWATRLCSIRKVMDLRSTMPEPLSPLPQNARVGRGGVSMEEEFPWRDLMMGFLPPLVVHESVDNLFTRLVLILHHLWLDEDMRYEIARAILGAGIVSQRQLTLPVKFKSGLRMNLLQYCIRSKARRWRDLLLLYWPQSARATPSSLASGGLTEVALLGVGRDAIPGPVLDCTAEEWESSSGWMEGLVLATVVGMSPAFPKAASLCFPDSGLTNFTPLDCKIATVRQ